MKKRVSDKMWFPFWVDKWIFGSIRIECTLEERAIWVDLLALASKDDGHIRANEDIPYPIQQLSGMLMINEDILEKAIDKFIQMTKLTKLKNGTLLITKWDKYQLSESYHRVKKHREKKESNGKMLQCNKNPLTNKIKEKKRKEDKIKEYTKEFSQFWNAYDYKIGKKDALKAFIALRRKGVELKEIAKATNGYLDYLKSQKIHNNFDQAKKHPATFLRGDRWKEFLDFKYEPRL